MTSLRRSKCKCGKTIIWGQDEDTGAKIPLDAVAPTYRRVDPTSDRIVRANALVSHFATCSHANEFSKKGK